MRGRCHIAIQICLLALLAGCQKEKNDGSEKTFMLTTEGYTSQAKTSVNDLSVQWVDGDMVCLNWERLPVTVSGDHAYVSGSFSGEVWGFSPESLSESVVWNKANKQLTVTFPSSYLCSYIGGRQKIDLPMAAYATSVGDAIPFRHLSAAVKVLVTNLTANDMMLDSVVVRSTAYKLSGSVTATLFDDAAPAIEAKAGSGRVTVKFSGVVSLAADHADTVEVQVPIRPIGASDLTIEVFAHRQGETIGIDGVPTVYKSVDYHFNGTHSTPALGRNVMLTAGIRLQGSTPRIVVDHSLFSVSDGEKVRFSKGNLQFIGGEWQFAATQDTYLGSTQSDGNRDLFGWGTKDNPDNVSTFDSDYPSFNEWGENIGAFWRTLTRSEWDYLINSRPGNRFAKAYLKGSVHGLILLPDGYVHPAGLVPLSGINQTDGSSWDVNTYTASEWAQMESAGAIFLPAAGYRNGTSVSSAGSEGYYWSSINSSTDNAYRMYFSSSETVATNAQGRHYGCSVRLVKDAN